MKNSLINIAALCALLIILHHPHAKAGKPGGNKGGGNSGPSYTIHQLDDFEGFLTGVFPADINEANEIVGWVDDSLNRYAAVYWSTDTSNGTSKLKFLTDGAVAYAINVHGEIVGGQFDADGQSIARYWSDHSDAEPLSLLPLSGDEESLALEINRDGVIAGWSQRSIIGPDPRPGSDPDQIITLKTERRPVVWRILNGVAEGPFELPNLTDIDPTADPDNAYGLASSLNDNDEQGIATVVGNFLQSEELAARWTISFDDNGQLAVIGEVLATAASAAHVNNDDVTCGSVIHSTPSPQAAVWSPDEIILHRQRDVYINGALQTNAGGLIVGWGYTDSRKGGTGGGIRAVMWPSSNSQMIRLDDFHNSKSSLGSLTSAEAVNDHNIIVGPAQGGGFFAVPSVTGE